MFLHIYYAVNIPKNASAAKANQPRMFGRERISCALFVRLESDGRGIKNDPIATIKLNKLTTND